MTIGLQAEIDYLARVVEIVGVGIIVIATLVGAAIFLARGFGARDWVAAYHGFRANLGRGILLGLEFLVAADIMATVTAPLTLESVGLLGLVILIRTFLSFSLETEIGGRWPWKRADREPRAGQRQGQGQSALERSGARSGPEQREAARD